MSQADDLDRLAYMFMIQESFEREFLKDRGIDLGILKSSNFDDTDKVTYNKEFILCLIKECSELLDNINWKTHTYQTNRFLRDNFAEGCIDVFKYLLILCVINGIDENDLFEKFKQKTEVVAAKVKQRKLLMDLKSGRITKPIAIVDIDGVLGKYPVHFNKFISLRTNGKYDDIKVLRLDNPREYEKLKREYRLSGEKRFTPVMDYAVEFTHKLKRDGYFVLLLTARPYDEISRIYYDTMWWLNNNDIYFDAIIWDRNKAEFAVDNLMGCNIALCVDDDIENAKSLSRLSKVFLVDNKAINEKERYKNLPSNIKVVESLKEIKYGTSKG